MALSDYSDVKELKRVIALFWTCSSGNSSPAPHVKMPISPVGKYRFAGALLRAATEFKSGITGRATIAVIANLALGIADSLASRGETTALHVTEWLLDQAKLTMRRKIDVQNWRRDYLQALQVRRLTDLIRVVRRYWS